MSPMNHYLVRTTNGKVLFNHTLTYRLFSPIVRWWDRLRHGVNCPECGRVSPADLIGNHDYDEYGDVEATTIVCGVCGYVGEPADFQLTNAQAVKLK